MLVPSVTGLESSYYAFYEILGNAVLWISRAVES